MMTEAILPGLLKTGEPEKIVKTLAAFAND